MSHKSADRATQQAAPTRGRMIRRWARVYDPVVWLMSLGRARSIRAQAARLAAPKDGERVLDVGCGTGVLAFAAKSLAPGASVRGIDASPEMIAVARKKARRTQTDVTFDVAAIEALPFGDAEFDAVLSSLMLHHLPADVKAAGLAEVARVLKPDGRFVAVDFAGARRGLLSHVFSLFGHQHAHGDAHELLDAIRAAGFNQLDVPQTKFKSLVFVRARKSAATAGDAQAHTTARTV